VENLPVFTSVARVHATDQDIGLNGLVTYSLSPSTRASYGQIFSVNNETGVIFVIGQVDFESTPVFNLIVSASDNGIVSFFWCQC